jgi:type II secretory pathway pseudopilin PulG
MTNAATTAGLAGASGPVAARSATRGMTLVELTIVVLIMGLSVVAVLTTAAMLFRDTEELKSEARTLAGFLEHVRTLAALNGRTYTVQYDVGDDQKYFVWAPRRAEEGEVYEERDEDDARTATGVHQMPSRQNASGNRYYSVWIAGIAYGDGSSARENEVRIDFTPVGGSHWHYVYLTNEQGEYYTVEINPFTGFGEVYPGEVKPEPPERLR